MGIFMLLCYVLKASGLIVLFLSLTNRNPKAVLCRHRVLPPESNLMYFRFPLGLQIFGKQSYPP